MDALKAGAHKVQESMQGKKVEDKLETAADPSKKPSERADAAHDAAKAAYKEEQHACKADHKAHEHKH